MTHPTVQEADLPSRYDPKISEPKWQKYWEEEQFFAHKPTAESFTIDTPPPTVSGRMHIGHAFSYAQGDFYARFMRMKTGAVFFPFGTDDNGLPTERLVEKMKNVKGTMMKRSEFIALCDKTVQEIKPEFVSDWIKMGISCDFQNSYATINRHSQATSQRSFIDLYKKGKIYREESPVAWCVQCQTAIAQAEFDNVEQQSTFNDITFHIEGHPVSIATTRPELLPACVALCAHPDDARYTKYRGKKAKVPLFDYDVPIIFDEKAEMDKGTGILMVCTFGDKDDIDKWRRHKLELKIVLTRDGKLNEHAGKYAGLKIKDARKAIIEDLKTHHLLTHQKPITHAVNVHERCGTEIEFLKTPQWYIRVLDMKEELLKAADEITWHPEHMKVRYTHWVENLGWDWCISRQRFFGVPFPVWYDEHGKIVLADVEQLPVDPLSDKPASVPEAKWKHLTPEADVMDTWATSSVTPQIALDWLGNPEFDKLMPMTVRTQAHEIIRTWAFYTIVKSLLHHKKVPWKNIMLSGYVTDPHGQKMSKSKGNVVDPNVIINKYSADAVRFWSAGCKLGDDIPFSEKELTSGQKTITKLWNASRFVIMNLSDYHDEWTGRFDELEVLDRWILSRCNNLVRDCSEALLSYEHNKVRMQVENFFWNDFCDNYLEIVKSRLYEPKDIMQKRSAQFALQHVLSALLKLFAPLLPFITEEIYQLRFAKLEGKKSIHISSWPEFREDWQDQQAEIVGAEIVRIVAEVRKHKTAKQMAMNAPLARLTVKTNVDIALAQNDLMSVTKAQNLSHKKEDEGELQVEIE
jgi:valyl-tRNA synthetase